MLEETQDEQEIIARVAALDIGKAELVSRRASTTVIVQAPEPRLGRGGPASDQAGSDGRAIPRRFGRASVQRVAVVAELVTSDVTRILCRSDRTDRARDDRTSAAFGAETMRSAVIMDPWIPLLAPYRDSIHERKLEAGPGRAPAISDS